MFPHSASTSSPTSHSRQRMANQDRHREEILQALTRMLSSSARRPYAPMPTVASLGYDVTKIRKVPSAGRSRKRYP